MIIFLRYQLKIVSELFWAFHCHSNFMIGGTEKPGFGSWWKWCWGIPWCPMVIPRDEGWKGWSPIMGGEKAPRDPRELSSLSFKWTSSCFFKLLRSLARRFWNQILTWNYERKIRTCCKAHKRAYFHWFFEYFKGVIELLPVFPKDQYHWLAPPSSWWWCTCCSGTPSPAPASGGRCTPPCTCL